MKEKTKKRKIASAQSDYRVCPSCKKPISEKWVSGIQYEAIRRLVNRAKADAKRDIIERIERMEKDLENGKIILMELGCGRCYSQNHTKVPYGCSCVCHRIMVLEVLKEKMKKEVEKR